MFTSFVRIVVAIAIPFVCLAPIAGAAEVFTTGPAGGNQPHSTIQPSLGINYLVRTSGSTSRLGEIHLFGGDFAPPGYQFAHGQPLNISGNDDLFQAIGTMYGGDGETTFNLPDLRGRTAIGNGAGAGTFYDYGIPVGSEEVTLHVNNLPPHTHSTPLGETHAVGGGQPYNNMQPSLPLSHRIITSGPFPSRDSSFDTSAPMLGQIILSAAPFNPSSPPANQMETNGQLLPINTNQGLFALFGDNYGGNAQTTVGIPNQRGRALVHSGGATQDGAWPPPVGDMTGQESLTLAESQMPTHAHTLTAAPFVQTGPAGGGQPQENHQPGVAVNYIIALQGIFPPDSADPNSGDPMGDDPFVGEIAMFAGEFAPFGWAFCNGQLLVKNQNTALFHILGTTFGGDGINNFALPDLKGRIPVGFGQGQGLSEWEMGMMVGEQSVTLLQSQIPVHTHTYVPEPAAAALAGFMLGLPLLHRRRRI